MVALQSKTMTPGLIEQYLDLLLRILFLTMATIAPEE
jgi:hypothetical protein